MSHFSVLIVADEYPSDEVIKRLMQPYHEYECTGVDDQYVVDVDVHDEAESAYARYTYTRWRDAGGALHDPYEDRFYREMTPEEIKKHGTMLGIGSGGGISWASQDWGDGRGYRAKAHMEAADAGMTEVEVPASDVETIDAWAKDYGGWTRSATGRFVKHTNPNAQWDWYELGGRYSGKLFTLGNADSRKGKPGLMGSLYTEAGKDVASRADLNFATMKNAAEASRMEWLGEIQQKTGLPEDVLWVALLDLEAAHANWLQLPEPRPRGADYSTWLKTAASPNAAHVNRAVDEVPKLGQFKSCAEWVKAAPALTAWAVLKDGQWTEKGSMGWWGVSTGDKDEGDWQREVSDMIRDLPADRWLAVVDCHI